MTRSPKHPTEPLTLPEGCNLATGQTCSFAVNVAVDMCQQWLKNGNGTWTPNDPCQYTSGFNLADFTFWGPYSSTFTYDAKTHTEPFAIAATPVGTQTTYLAFRGTQTDVDLGIDLDDGLGAYGGPGGGKVSAGFNAVSVGLDLAPFWDDFPPGNTLILTGHSLGSAIATLLVPQLVGKVAPGHLLQYNQASPRVGDAQFADNYASTGVPTFRLVNTYDLIPKLPPGKKYVAVAPNGEAPFGAFYEDPVCDPKQNHDPCCTYSYALFNGSDPFNSDHGTCMKPAG